MATPFAHAPGRAGCRRCREAIPFIGRATSHGLNGLSDQRRKWLEVPQKDFRKTELCQQLYKVMGAEYQIAMPFAIPGSASIAIVFNRARDFGPRDRELLTLLQPMVCSAYRNIQKMTDLQFSQEQLQAAVNSRNGAEVPSMHRYALSGRQRVVLGKLMDGKSNKQIALDLNLSTRTVEKYVEQVLRKLNVPTRAAASAKFHKLSLNGLL